MCITLVSKIDQMTTTQNQMFYRNETTPAPTKGSTGIPDLSSEELRKCVSKLPILFYEDSNEGEFVGWGYYTGGKLPGDKNGYENFVSKQFKNVGEALTLQFTEGGRKDGDDRRELARIWKSFTQDKRDHWEEFARGGAAEPMMCIEDLEDLVREGLMESGAAEIQEYFLRTREEVAHTTEVRVRDYLAKHNLTGVLVEAIATAVEVQSDDPKVFIANFLYDKAGIAHPRNWTPEEWTKWEAEHSHWTPEDWDKWESEQGGHLAVVVKE